MDKHTSILLSLSDSIANSLDLTDDLSKSLSSGDGRTSLDIIQQIVPLLTKAVKTAKELHDHIIIDYYAKEKIDDESDLYTVEFIVSAAPGQTYKEAEESILYVIGRIEEEFGHKVKMDVARGDGSVICKFAEKLSVLDVIDIIKYVDAHNMSNDAEDGPVLLFEHPTKDNVVGFVSGFVLDDGYKKYYYEDWAGLILNQ